MFDKAFYPHLTINLELKRHFIHDEGVSNANVAIGILGRSRETRVLVPALLQAGWVTPAHNNKIAGGQCPPCYTPSPSGSCCGHAARLSLKEEKVCAVCGGRAFQRCPCHNAACWEWELDPLRLALDSAAKDYVLGDGGKTRRKETRTPDDHCVGPRGLHTQPGLFCEKAYSFFSF